MFNLTLEKVINVILFFYIFSLYLFTYKEGLNVISNSIAFLLIFLIWVNFLSTKKKFVFNKLMFTQFLFILICTISLFYAIDKNLVLSKIKTLILIFIVMFSLVNYIDTFEKIRKIMVYFVYSGVFTSLYILKSSDFLVVTRYGSELGNVNAVGMIIGISSIFSFYINLNEKKYYQIVFLFIMIPTVLLTGSRKAILFVIISIIFILFLRDRGNFKNIIKFLAIGTLVLALFNYIIFSIPLFHEIIGSRFEELFSFITGKGTDEASINTRAFLIKFGMEIFRGRPFLGYGIDNYSVLLGMHVGENTYAHNNYVELLVDVGILGIVFYYLTHIVVIKELFYASKETINKTICYVFIAIIVSYFILSPSLIYYDSKHFSFILAIASTIFKIGKLDEGHTG